ncbi:MAG: TetR/AcrR family transcriptional regulator [Acidimicrobiales bacterium]
MPKIVDWEARKDEILEATWRVIARDGLARTTVRAIAREANCSQGILSHYFDDKMDILASALLLSHRRVRERTEKKVAGRTGLEALRIAMREALPLDAERELEARIEVSFWGRLLSDARLSDLGEHEVDLLRTRLRGHLVEAREAGELVEGLDLDLETQELLVLIDGVSVERVHFPGSVPPARQLELLERRLSSFAKPA